MSAPLTSSAQLKIRASSLLLLLFTLYGMNHFLFERLLYFNELLSLAGLLFFLSHSFTTGPRFIYPKNVVYRCVLWFLLIGFIYALLSIAVKTNWYYYLRNFSIIYSAFSFFLGYHLYPAQYDFFRKTKKLIYGYAFFSFGLRWEQLIDRNAYAFWFAQVKANWALRSVAGLVAIYVLYIISYTSLTVALILIFVLMMRYLKNYTQFKFIAFAAVVTFVIILMVASPHLALYKTNTDSIFGNVENVYAQHTLFSLDPNSSWRLLFWYRILVENFPQNLLGIGIGTPLLPYVPGNNSTGLPVDDETLAHVIGTHNTFITLFARFGLASTLIFAVLYNHILKDYFRFKNYYLNNRNDGGVFLAFFTLTCVGLFNLLIESVTLASLYWVSLGFVARSINIRRYEQQPL